MFTKKHYIAIAAIVAMIHNEADKVLTASRFIRLFEASNPRFDKSKFLDACGI